VWRAAVIWLAGCGRLGFDNRMPPDAATPVVVGAISGTRLRAEHWQSTDGVAQFARWYDTLLDTPCQWNQVNDAHCLPTSVTFGVFADSACTKFVVRGTPDWAPKFALAPTAPATVFTVIDTPIAGYVLTNNTCGPANDGQTYYALGTAVPDTMFVSGNSVATPIGDGLSLVEVVGDDGSRMVYDLATTSDSAACDIAPTASSHTFCVPRSGLDAEPVTREYQDAACSVDAVSFDMGSAYAAIGYESEPCAVRTVQLGPLQPAAPLYIRDVIGACIQEPFPPGTFARITDAGPGLVPLAAVDVAVGSRLRASAWQTPGGGLVFRTLYDSTLQAACLPRTSADTGQTYCVPPDSNPGITASVSGNCSAAPVTMTIGCTIPGVNGATAGDGRDGPTYHFAQFTEIPVAPPITASDGTACAAVEIGNAPVSTRGALVSFDPSGLAGMTLVRD
jgi:hypothetical protein